ncbi:hypothetical protein [Pelagicoccus sp. SDUM812005]|uniref:hypothetical protein n=1 Tax=Pelagicoccus sp. SDUM812005 TaxID=3041257 RepID=UPI00280D2D29|nr:hypothetical protein [Pelagicoccus sp. SDUM812005]MDQ8182082.1 hypothetical protein [Pelagicoccus sp. SDUM812005]
MFAPRLSYPIRNVQDPDSTKLYAINAENAAIDPATFLPRLAELKQAHEVDWPQTPSFAIFHEGANLRYLVLAWWGNDNELFNSVSVEFDGQWLSDPNRFSFCLWDLEVIWHERNSFIKHLYSGTSDIAAYRNDLMEPIQSKN